MGPDAVGLVSSQEGGIQIHREKTRRGRRGEDAVWGPGREALGGTSPPAPGPRTPIPQEGERSVWGSRGPPGTSTEQELSVGRTWGLNLGLKQRLA